MSHSDRLRIAVFIDFDNIEIGVKNTLGASFDAGLVLEALKERGEVVSKTAYSDWQRAAGYSRGLTQHAIKMVQRNLTPGGDKNGADINLALDALEMAFTHSHINAFVIVGGDSDFISLVEKLKQYDRKVFIVGGRQFTSAILQRNCHEFIAYENLVSASTGSSSRRQSGGRDVRVERAPIEQVVPLVTRALKVLADREVSPQIGLLKSTLLQLDSTFSERSYGAGSFRDFVQKLENLGIVRATQGKGGWLVTAADGRPAVVDGDEGDVMPAAPSVAAESPAATSNATAAPARGEQRPDVVGTAADGLKEFRSMLGATQVRRWPMYLRNVKQFIRQVNASFDERAYGFGNLVDLLRAAQREGIVRVERDRQGVIRIFQGSGMPVASPVTNGTDAHDADDQGGLAHVASEIGVPLIEEEVNGNVAPPPMPEVDAAAEQEQDDVNGNVAPTSRAHAAPPRARRRAPRAASAAPSRPASATSSRPAARARRPLKKG